MPAPENEFNLILKQPQRQDDSVHLSHISTHILTRFYIHEQS